MVLQEIYGKWPIQRNQNQLDYKIGKAKKATRARGTSR